MDPVVKVEGQPIDSRSKAPSIRDLLDQVHQQLKAQEQRLAQLHSTCTLPLDPRDHATEMATIDTKRTAALRAQSAIDTRTSAITGLLQSQLLMVHDDQRLQAAAAATTTRRTEPVALDHESHLPATSSSSTTSTAASSSETDTHASTSLVDSDKQALTIQLLVLCNAIQEHRVAEARRRLQQQQHRDGEASKRPASAIDVDDELSNELAYAGDGDRSRKRPRTGTSEPWALEE